MGPERSLTDDGFVEVGDAPATAPDDAFTLRDLNRIAPATSTRHTLRSRRKRRVRARSISVKRMPKREVQFGRALYPDEDDVGRPKTRGDCAGGARPCPYVSCAHHLYLDVTPKTGAIKLNFPDLEPDEMAHSCALDVADEGGKPLEDVGAFTNLTRERIRQIEVRAKQLMRKRLAPILADTRDEPKVHLRMVVDDELDGVEELDVGSEVLFDHVREFA